MKFGTAVHTALLQPDEFAQRYALAEKIDRRTKEGKAAAAAWEERNAGKIPLDPDNWQAVQTAVANVKAFGPAADLIKAFTDTELTALWRDPSGLRIKGRIDAVAEVDGLTYLVDLKTTRSASRDDFAKSIAVFGYHRQLANYAAGLRAHGVNVEDAYVIAVENEPPHAVAVFRVRQDTLAIGEESLRKIIEAYAECERLDVWPGYPQEVQEIALPEWAAKKEFAL
jgi:ATP-dependent exoDNAse (exonuclease V) beta subunit